MMNDIARRLKILFPSVDLSPGGNVQVQNDGQGAYIAKWDAALGTQPTQAQLLAVDVAQTPDEKTDELVIPKKVLAALVLCADATGKPQWVQNAISQAKAAITAART